MKNPVFTKGGTPPVNKDARSVTHDERRLIEICKLPQQEALARLGVTALGLESEEAAAVWMNMA